MIDHVANGYQREIEDQALIFLRDYALVAYASLILTLSLVALAIYQSFPSNFVLIWIVTIWALQTWTLFYRRWLPTSQLKHEKKLQRGVLINIFEGLVISSCVLFFPYIDDILRMLIVTILLITCTGAIATTVGYLRFYLAFMTPIIAAVAIATTAAPLVFGGSDVLFIVATLSLLSSYPLIKMSQAIYSHFRDAFEANLRFEEANIGLQEAVREAHIANKSKTRFLAAASHDLRQPINTLSLFVANLSLLDVDDQQAEIIAHMNTAINSVDAQLESLLDMSKLDAGVVEANMKSTELVILLQDIVRSFQGRCGDHLSVNFHSNFDSVVSQTDPVLFERVLTNLVSNAIKYTNHGRVDVELNVSDSIAKLSVQDTGIGMAPAELERVFEEFYQVGNPERSEANGLGLGLSIVSRLAELLDLDINISSELGVGTEVTVELPAVSSRRSPIELKEVSTLSANDDSMNILALDNESTILLALRGVVETMGHSIETFTDSKSALTAFASQRFDLALIDFRLPGAMNGQDIIRKMRGINDSARFFLITGDSNITKAAQDCEIIYKPLTGKKLKSIFN